jgi:hypothetical protein
MNKGKIPMEISDVFRSFYVDFQLETQKRDVFESKANGKL